jgi:hypothetical protein
MEEGQTDRACSLHGTDKKFIEQSENQKGKDDFEDLGIDVKKNEMDLTEIYYECGLDSRAQ